MEISEILINSFQGKLYSQKSGDTNKIHTDEVVGYNSIYGEKICHGCFVFEKFLKNIKIKNCNQIYMNFEKHFSYNQKIKILKKNSNFSLIQNNSLKATVEIKQNNTKILLNLKNYKYFKLKKQKKIKSEKKIFQLLKNLSFHVGMVFPGNLSIINDICILKIKKEFKSVKDGIYSKQIKKGYPFIKNYLKSKEYLIEFNTLKRPFLKPSNKKINLSLIENLKNTNIKKTLIIGGSGGLGLDLIKIFLKNKKINIYATYFKNKIKLKNKNLNITKIDVIKDINKLIKIININNIDTVYYLPTPKISLNNSSKQKKIYKCIYEDLPIKLLKNIKFNSSFKFFYPSTIFINNQNKNSDYAKIKLGAEKKLKNLAGKIDLLNLSISRLPQLNSRQNLNILDVQYPSLIEVLNKDKKIQGEFFFV